MVCVGGVAVVDGQRDGGGESQGRRGGGGGAGDVHLSSVSIRRYSVLFSTSLLENSERMNQRACIM
jgi:hypothetical protein